MITIVDYKAGNLTSVRRALDRLEIPCLITGDADKIFQAERIIFPGVGNAKSAAEQLSKSGIAEALKAAAKKGTPFFGICLGMQIMMTRSDEGDVDCLGFFEGGVKLLTPNDRRLKIPHMGWDSLKYTRKHPLFRGIDPSSEFYFVHSYYADPTDKKNVIALSDHGIDFCAVIGQKNLFASQFHPEKSGQSGLNLLKNFAVWDGDENAE
ncbi:MAG: imidazole glycerol phosphate synthase subunit HisH [Clostridiales bacterium]|jgi:glutamine amidotransferase|nr:imidazole glycerol phosphate synthase subunit HisH [Clostridiales bacterium]